MRVLPTDMLLCEGALIMTEEEVKLNYITPAIERAGWDKAQIRMEYPITPGKIVVRGQKAVRLPGLRADYLLQYRENLPLAIIEAKDDSHNVGDGMQQALNYAAKLNVRFVFTSNGQNFLFHDREEGKEKAISLDAFPSPDELYEKQYGEKVSSSPNVKKAIEEPYLFSEETPAPRYYQTTAINKAVEAIADGQDRLLLVMATGTGKTYVAFQIIWRLWKAGIKKKVLYLADRNILIDQTMIGDFRPFKNHMYKVAKKNMDPSYEIYLALYQQLSEDDVEDNLAKLKESFKPDFFDFIIVDECHRGSAAEDSNWRKILDYFSSAAQLGMTATPKETQEVSNVDYFGKPIYVYSLKDGIEDGFLAPYRVVGMLSNVDATGYRPFDGQTDDNGEPIEDRVYGVNDYDRMLVIRDRTEYVAKQITDYLKQTDRYAKTIVFCVDIDHAERMRQELVNLNSDLCAEDDRYVMKITGDDSEGKRQLENFIDEDSRYPTIVTTSKLLTTGVNCPTCKNIVLDNLFGPNGMTEFKQIIGRGTRIDEEHGKMFFTILDFRGASRLFADPEFNGVEFDNPDYDPEYHKGKTVVTICDPAPVITATPVPSKQPVKRYISGVMVELLARKVQYMDASGKLVIDSLEDFSKRNMLHNFKTMDDFIHYWSSDEKRKIIVEELSNKGIFLDELHRYYSGDIDDFDLLCQIAYGTEPLTKKKRADRVKESEAFRELSCKCREVVSVILDKYGDGDVKDIGDLDVLKLPEFEQFGGLTGIVKTFGGAEKYRSTLHDLKTAMYSN